jgi:hypothetical protein
VSASQPITRPRSAADKLGLAPTTLTGPQLITIAAGGQLRTQLVHPRSQAVQDCTRSFLTSASGLSRRTGDFLLIQYRTDC